MTCGNDTLYAHSAALRNIELHNDVTSKTRGKEVNESSFHADFGLYGYTYNSDQSWKNNGSELQPTIKNEQITKGNTWTSSTYLPGKTKNMALFAYAPYMDTGIEVTGNQGAPQLTYTIAPEVSNQVDLLVAKNVDVLGNSSSVALDFKHALTAVKFAIGTITGFTKITKIVISGVKKSGTLSLDGDNWKLNESTASYTIEKDIDLSTSGDITGSSNDLMLLMPQILPSGAKLEVTMTNDIGTQTFSTDLNGEWKKGYTVTYQLSVDRVAGKFHFEVTPSTTSIPKEGGDFELKVKSYYQYTSDDAKKIPIPWSGTYNIGSNQYTLSGDGSVNDDIRKISVPANNSTLTHTETLQANPRKGTAEKPWNLSNSQGEAEVENTANCYVVNSKGIYSIPLVYGCAIKNGETNSQSYTSSYGTFKRHDDLQISGPYLKDNEITVDGAELLWQEVQGMITEVNVQDEKIVFTIGDKIAQGNALIAAKANGTIVWSWHIWVTDRNIYATVPIQTVAVSGTTQHTYNFMPVPLGWVDLNQGTSPVIYNINLIQYQSKKQLLATANQSGSPANDGTCTYYQWGRKDPFCPSDGTESNKDKKLYDISGNEVLFNPQSGRISTGTTIKSPNIFYYTQNGYDWNSMTYNDYWNATNGNITGMNDNAVYKTVYDPNPIGFKMPSPDAFTGFTKTGSKTENSDDFNVKNTTFNDGYYFYTQGFKQGQADFWSADGYRSYQTGILNKVRNQGYCWSAGPCEKERSYGSNYEAVRIDPSYDFGRAQGFSVRPVSE